MKHRKGRRLSEAVHQLEQRLHEANERRTRALTTFHDDRKEFNEANRAVLDLERELAAAKGEVYAVPLDFPVRPNMGAPVPHLLRTDYRCLLAFFCEKRGVVGSGDVDPFVIVEFEVCFSAKLGSPTENGFETHPLCGRGGDPRAVQQVMNSPWLREVEAIDRGHRPEDAASTHGLKHFIIWFHDSTFECLAQSFKVEMLRGSMSDMIVGVSDRLLD